MENNYISKAADRLHVWWTVALTMNTCCHQQETSTMAPLNRKHWKPLKTRTNLLQLHVFPCWEVYSDKEFCCLVLIFEGVKDPDVEKDWRQEEKGMTRGWDGWMASPSRWTWVWASSGSWWWIQKPGVLQSIGSQRVGHDWVTELNPGTSAEWYKRKYYQYLILTSKGTRNPMSGVCQDCEFAISLSTKTMVNVVGMINRHCNNAY